MYYHFNIEEQIQCIMNKCKSSDFENKITTTGKLCVTIVRHYVYKPYIMSYVEI